MLRRNALEIRNSSIRAKPANAEKIRKGLIAEKTLKRLLRMKISWASTVVVVIGKNTHTRPWVNWEIETAHRQGKRIVGVYEHGGTENDVPPALDKYRDAIVAWNSKNIIGAIEGLCDPQETPAGSEMANRDGSRGCAA